MFHIPNNWCHATNLLICFRQPGCHFPNYTTQYYFGGCTFKDITCMKSRFAKYKTKLPQQTHWSVELYACCHPDVQGQQVMLKRLTVRLAFLASLDGCVPLGTCSMGQTAKTQCIIQSTRGTEPPMVYILEVAPK